MRSIAIMQHRKNVVLLAAAAVCLASFSSSSFYTDAFTSILPSSSSSNTGNACYRYHSAFASVPATTRICTTASLSASSLSPPTNSMLFSSNVDAQEGKDDDDGEDDDEDEQKQKIPSDNSKVAKETAAEKDAVPTTSSATAEAAAPSAGPSLSKTILKTEGDDNLAFLQTLGAIAGRGEFATTTQKGAAAKVLKQLEAANPTEFPARSDLLRGTWELVYCHSGQLFRSSPFFMAGRAVCTTDLAAKRYDWFCDMHRAALAISQIEAVRQIVTSEGRLVSEFQVRAGAVPFLADFTPFRYSGGLPVAITGALVSSADVTATADGKGWEVYMDTVEIKGSNVPGLRQLLDSYVKLQSRQLAEVLEQTVSSYTTPKPVFRTTYLDDRHRISRDQDDNAFFYVKTSTSEKLTDYSKVDADLGLARLLEGFNDAVTRFYL